MAGDQTKGRADSRSAFFIRSGIRFQIRGIEQKTWTEGIILNLRAVYYPLQSLAPARSPRSVASARLTKSRPKPFTELKSANTR
jgi:hypothetical protein